MERAEQGIPGTSPVSLCFSDDREKSTSFVSEGTWTWVTASSVFGTAPSGCALRSANLFMSSVRHTPSYKSKSESVPKVISSHLPVSSPCKRESVRPSRLRSLPVPRSSHPPSSHPPQTPAAPVVIAKAWPPLPPQHLDRSVRSFFCQRCRPPASYSHRASRSSSRMGLRCDCRSGLGVHELDRGASG